ncbi:unnamed protein product [Amaranthus hypochondriacus]
MKCESSGSRNTTIPTNSIHSNTYFYKVITPTCRYKLEIPQDYQKKYGATLNNKHVYLQVRDGRVWRVELGHEHENLWLALGWNMLYETYSIQDGYVVVFRYIHQTNKFNVSIFDLTSNEIEYDEVFSNHQYFGPQGEKTMNYENSGTSNTTNPSNSNYSNTYFYKIMDAPTSRFKISIPNDYVKKYGASQLTNDFVKLRVSQGRVWMVELLKESNILWLAHGWKNLYDHYSLQDGYFVVFRNIKNSEFNISIFDTTQNKIEYQQDNFYKDGVTDGFDEDFQSNNPYFKIIMQASNVENRFRVSFPIHHVRNYLPLNSKQEVILKGPNQKCYKTKLNLYFKTSQAEIQNKWSKFVYENMVKLGDTCVFELVRTNPIIYNITIFRA